MAAQSSFEFTSVFREEAVVVFLNKFPELSRTSGLFPGFSSPGKCQNKIPGLSRFSRTRTNPAFSCICTGYWSRMLSLSVVGGWREEKVTLQIYHPLVRLFLNFLTLLSHATIDGVKCNVEIPRSYWFGLLGTLPGFPYLILAYPKRTQGNRDSRHCGQFV